MLGGLLLKKEKFMSNNLTQGVDVRSKQYLKIVYTSDL